MTETGNTIDRIQIEISADLSQFLSDMEQAGAAIDSAKQKLSTLESTAGKAGGNMDGLTAAASRSKEAFTQYENAATGTGATIDRLTDGAGDMGEALTETGKAAKKALSGTEAFKDGIEDTLEPVDNVKKGVEKLTGILKFTGIATAAGIALNAVKSYIEDVKNEADAAYTKINTMGTSLSTLSGKLTATDQAVIESLAPYTTDTATTTEIQTKVKQTQAGTSATDQKELIDKFETAAQSMGINPAELYTSVYSAMVKAGEDPTPDNILTLLDDTISPIFQTTGADIKQILSIIGSNADTLKNTGLSLSEQIKAGGQSYQKTQDYTQFENLLTGAGETYEARYNAYLKQAGAGDEDPTTWLKKQSGDKQIQLDAAASTAASAAVKNIGAEIRKGIESMDLSGALTLTQSKFLGMTDAEIKAYTEARLNQLTEDGKYNIFEQGNQIDQEYYNRLRYANIGEESGQISDKQYIADVQTAKLIQNSAVSQSWADIGATLLSLNTKTGADYWTQSEAYYNNMLKGTGTTTATGTALNFQLADGQEPLEIPITYTPDLSGIGTETGTALTDIELSGTASKSLEEAGGYIDDLGTATENAQPILEGFIESAADPLKESLEGQGAAVQTYIDVSTASNNYSTETTVPVMITEKGIVDSLTQSYLDLAAAKQAASEA